MSDQLSFDDQQAPEPRREPVRHTPSVRRRPSAPITRADVLSVADVARILGCSRRHLYYLVDRGELPGARHLGHRIVIVRPVLEAWLLGGDRET